MNAEISDETIAALAHIRSEETKLIAALALSTCDRVAALQKILMALTESLHADNPGAIAMLSSLEQLEAVSRDEEKLRVALGRYFTGGDQGKLAAGPLQAGSDLHRSE